MAKSAKTQLMENVRNLGWDTLSLTSAEFKGGVKVYTAADGSAIAVLFGRHEGFVVEDDAGLFTINDLVDGVINDPDFNVDESGTIDGTTVLGESGLWEGDGPAEVTLFEESLEKYGIASDEIKEDITKRLLVLSEFDQQITIMG